MLGTRSCKIDRIHNKSRLSKACWTCNWMTLIIYMWHSVTSKLFIDDTRERYVWIFTLLNWKPYSITHKIDRVACCLRAKIWNHKYSYTFHVHVDVVDINVSTLKENHTILSCFAQFQLLHLIQTSLWILFIYFRFI